MLCRYYIRIANQLLVEDEEDVEGKGFVMLTADINVRLKKSLREKGKKNKGAERGYHCIQRRSLPFDDIILLLCCAVLCCAVLCCAVLCCAVLCCAVLYCTVLY